MKLPNLKIELCAAKNDIRHYLNGVYLDVWRKTLTASTGSYLSRIHCEPEDDDVSCIIPTAAFTAARKLCTKKSPPVYIRTRKISEEQIEVRVTNELEYIVFLGINGLYPNVDSVIPPSPPAISIALNAEFLATIQRTICVNSELGAVQIDIIDENTPFIISSSNTNVDIAILCPVRRLDQR